MLTPLPYTADVAALFEVVADRPWAMLLDSAGLGRYDIIVADPMITLVTRDRVTEICQGDSCRQENGDPLGLLRALLQPVASQESAELPFQGGAVGYFAYDLVRQLEGSGCTDSGELPELAVGIYDWAVVLDHQARRAWLAASGHDPHTAQRWPELCRLFSTPLAASSRQPFCLQTPLRSNMEMQEYGAAFARIQRYLREGDCYQVNLAQCFRARGEGDPWELYRRLRRDNPAPFSAYLNTPHGQVLSASPERFLQVREGLVETRPIKGTRPRVADPARDAALAEELRHSAKDRAENLMIVDLLRNDLGKNCVPGSVQVPRLFEVESFATVHHLVSTVTGRLAADQDAIDLLRGCFPGGSITGAPKRRAMEIIEELEPERRDIYCGAIGYIGFDGAMDSNIAIRTLLHRAGAVQFSAGGGIVVDSELEQEYQECLDKAAALRQVLEQCRRTESTAVS